MSLPESELDLKNIPASFSKGTPPCAAAEACLPQGDRQNNRRRRKYLNHKDVTEEPRGTSLCSALFFPHNVPFSLHPSSEEKISVERRVLSTLRDTDKQTKGGMSRTMSGKMSRDWPKPAQAPTLLMNSLWVIQDDALLLQPQPAEVRAGLEHQLQRAVKITSTDKRRSPFKSEHSYNSLIGWGFCSPSHWRSSCLSLRAPCICQE